MLDPQIRQSTSRNIPFSAGVGDKYDMWEKIMKEVWDKRVAGPYNSIPFDNYMQLPIGLVPKAADKTRLIFHLSYNFSDREEDGSLNYFTPKGLCTTQYNDLDYAISCCLEACDKICRLMNSSIDDPIYLSKTDLRSAFCMFLVSQLDWPWLIFKAEHPITGWVAYFVDKCLPFGASISCSLFQCFSNALRHIVEKLTGKPHSITNYLDDFLFTDISQEGCNSLVRTFLAVCNHVHLPVADDKTEWASTQIVFLGILLDGRRFILAIPLDKREKALTMLKYLINKQKATVKQLQNLMGHLNFLSNAIHPGRAFTGCIYSKFSNILENKSGKVKSYHHVRLDSEFDCQVWKLFLEQSDHLVVCRLMIDLKAPYTTAVQLEFYSDASTSEVLGFRGIFNKHWLYGAWPPISQA